MSDSDNLVEYGEDDSFDLRGIIRTLIQYGKFIVGATILLGLIGLVVALSIPREYEAVSLVAISTRFYERVTGGNYVVLEGEAILNERVVTGGEVNLSPASVLPFAVSDQLLMEVIEAMPSALPSGTWRPDRLRGMLSAKATSDLNTIELRVRHENPETAATLVNGWAEILTRRLREAYGQGQADLDYMQRQLTEAEAAYEEAVSALVEFQARDRGAWYDAELSSRKMAMESYIDDRERLYALTHDIDNLLAQLDGASSTAGATQVDDLSLFILKLRALSGDARLPTIMLDYRQSVAGDSTLSPEAMRSALQGIKDSLQSRAALADARVNEIRPEILTLQQDLQKLKGERDGLESSRRVALENRYSLARKMADLQVVVQDVSTAKVTSKASTPTQPVGRGALMSIVTYAALGLILSISGALAWDWWRRGRTETE